MVYQEGDNHRGHSPFLQIQTSTCLIVPEWSTQSIFGLTGAMLAAVAASVTYECLHEYLMHLKRTALNKDGRSECCGTPVVTCGEKLGQSIIQVMRVTFAYFMMLCVMTMNVWLLIAIVLGASVGYGVGKPIVANGMHDAVTSHGYSSATVDISRKKNRRSQRSRSWRYQPISGQQMRPLHDGPDDVFSEQYGGQGVSVDKKPQSQNKKDVQMSDNIIWLRRSNEDIPSLPLRLPLHNTRAAISPDNSAAASNLENTSSSQQDTAAGPPSGGSKSLGRFKSTSKVISQSFRSYSSDVSTSSRSSNPRQHSKTSVFSANSPETMPKDDRNKATRSASKVSRTSSSASGRFKPVSRQIRRQMSFDDDLDS